MTNTVEYTVQKISKKDKVYGVVHGSYNVRETICGVDINENWTVITNDYDGKITCKKCLGGK